jgi:hypothetical protein
MSLDCPPDQVRGQALQRENVVGLLVHHLLGDVALAAHRIDGHDRSVNRQHVQQLRMAVISFDFSATLTCPSTRRWRAAKAETM